MIQVWDEDVSSFTIEVDEHQLVRRATIDSQDYTNRYVYEMTSEGVFDHQGIRIAKSGTYRQKILRPSNDKNGGVDTKVHREWQIELNHIDLNLSDAEFDEFTHFDIEPGMQVDDRVNAMHGTGVLRENGRVEVE